MNNIIKRYLDKNLFYVSVIITGITSLLFGLFYTVFKNVLFENTASNFLEGTGVLSSYVTVTTSEVSYTNYFVIGFILSLLFFFFISFIIHLYSKKSFLKIFNLISILNVIWIVAFICACILIQVSNIFTYVFLVVVLLVYLYLFYRFWDLSKRKKIISLAILTIAIIIILVLLNLFV